MNHKLVYRLYTAEGLSVRTKKRTKRASHLRVVLPAAEAPKERWSMVRVRSAIGNVTHVLVEVLEPRSEG